MQPKAASIEADRTLVTTFSRKAADELRTRLWSLGVSGVQAGTFHRTALGLLREHLAEVARRGYAIPPDCIERDWSEPHGRRAGTVQGRVRRFPRQSCGARP